MDFSEAGEFRLFTEAEWSLGENWTSSIFTFPEKLSRKLFTAGVNGHHTGDGRSSVPYFEQSSGSALFNDRPLDKACRGEIVH